MSNGRFSNTYTILACGSHKPDSVTQIDTRSVHQLSPDIQTEVDQRWHDALKRAAEEGRDLFNAKVLRLDKLFHQNGHLHLFYGLTSYCDYAMTRGICEAKPWTNNPDPIGSVVIASTIDRLVPLGRRSRRADVNPGRYFTFGGFFDPDDLDGNGQADIFRCAAREWKEETGLEVSSHDLSLISVVYDLVHPHPEIGFFTRLDQTADEIRASDWASELDELTFIPEADLTEFARTHADEFVDSLLGAIDALGRCTIPTERL